MPWFQRKDDKLKDRKKKSIPDDLWLKCPSCTEILYKPELTKNHSVCHHCNYHFRIKPADYLKLIVDEGTAVEVYKDISSVDILKFKSEKKIYRPVKSRQKEN